MELESRVRLREMMKKQWQFLAMYNDETIPGAQLRNLIGTIPFSYAISARTQGHKCPCNVR